MEEDLKEITAQRDTRRKLRRKQEIPVCALVAYTNAGKSSLLNALTNAGVAAEDKLFTTLDSSSRRLKLPGGLSCLLVDTVGFIRRLPHTLVKAFRSTLEEAAAADIVIHVLDSSDPDIKNHYETTISVLKELDADNIPRLLVLNKIDKLSGETYDNSSEVYIEELKQHYDAVQVSALTGVGLEELLDRIENMLSHRVYCFCFPPARSDLAASLYRNGIVISENYTDDSIEVKARVDEKTAGRLKNFLIK